MTELTVVPRFLGRVERDSQGRLWAVLYRGHTVAAREQVRSARRGRRRIADMLLAAIDAGQSHWRNRSDPDARSTDPQLSGTSGRSVVDSGGTARIAARHLVAVR